MRALEKPKDRSGAVPGERPDPPHIDACGAQKLCTTSPESVAGAPATEGTPAPGGMASPAPSISGA
eukprot:1427294-Alexandrium_andersonii.AAC.1